LRMVRGSDVQALAWTQKQASGKSVAVVQKLFKLMNQPDVVAVPKDEGRSAKGAVSSGPKNGVTPGSKGSGSPEPTTPSTTPSVVPSL
jgi:hypothetical protein